MTEKDPILPLDNSPSNEEGDVGPVQESKEMVGRSSFVKFAETISNSEVEVLAVVCFRDIDRSAKHMGEYLDQVRKFGEEARGINGFITAEDRRRVAEKEIILEYRIFPTQGGYLNYLRGSKVGDSRVFSLGGINVTCKIEAIYNP